MGQPVVHSRWPRRFARFAWFIVVVIAGMGLGAIILFIWNRNTAAPPSWGSVGGVRNGASDIASFLVQVGLAVTSGLFGALIVGRRPRQRIGWLMLAIGLAANATPLFSEWTIYGYYTSEEPFPGLGLVGWVTNWLWIVLFSLLLLMLAIFPDGEMLSRRWRWLTGFPIALFTVSALTATMIETPMSSAYQAPNPFFRERYMTLYNSLFFVFTIAMPVAVVTVLAEVLARFRQSRGRERQQMKWLMGGVALMAVMVIGGLALALLLDVWLGDVLVNSSIIGALLGIGVAMLRHQLYDIDLIIRRTLIYSVLTALLALIYFSSVVMLQGLMTAVSGKPSSLTVVVSTLAIAVLFSPLRRRVQEIIDRRFFRSKYDAEQMLSQFAQTARGETELARLGEELLSVVSETMQPRQAWLWLRDEGRDEGRAVAGRAGAPYRNSAS